MQQTTSGSAAGEKVLSPPAPGSGRKQWDSSGEEDLSMLETDALLPLSASMAARRDKDDTRSVTGTAGPTEDRPEETLMVDEQDGGGAAGGDNALSASFAARRDVATAAQQQPPPPPQEAQQQPKPHSQVSNHPIKLSTDPLPSDNITN